MGETEGRAHVRPSASQVVSVVDEVVAESGNVRQHKEAVLDGVDSFKSEVGPSNDVQLEQSFKSEVEMDGQSEQSFKSVC